MLITIIDNCDYHSPSSPYSRRERPDAVVERAQKGEKPQSSQVAHLIVATFSLHNRNRIRDKYQSLSSHGEKSYKVVSSEQGFWIISNRLKSYWEQMLTAVQEVS